MAVNGHRHGQTDVANNPLTLSGTCLKSFLLHRDAALDMAWPSA
jgi:hypothetical protein